jgi:hypothetical protein
VNYIVTKSGVRSGFKFQKRKSFFSFPKHPSYSMANGGYFLGCNAGRYQVSPSPLFSAEFKNVASCNFTSLHCLYGMHRDRSGF